MKKITLLSLSLLFLSLISLAQIPKGSLLIGGGVAFSENKQDNSNNQSKGFAVSPSLGYAYKENKVIGLQLSYGHSTSDNNATPVIETHNNDYGASVFLRNYLPVAKNFYLFGQGQAGFGYNKNRSREYNNTERTIEQFSTSISLFPGLSYALNKRFQLEMFMNSLLQISYANSKMEVGGPFPVESKTSTLNFNINANPLSDLGLGFRVILGK